MFNYTDSGGVVHRFDTRAEFDAYILTITSAADLETIDIQKKIEKKKERITLGLSLIEQQDGYMDFKGFEAELKATRKAIKLILKPLYTELTDGNLKDAIDEIKAITNAQIDGTYIKKPKLLIMRNAIETFLGLPLSTSYNQ